MHPTAPASETSPEAGWIALASVHFFPWILLGIGFLQDIFYAVLPYSLRGVMLAGWGFTLLRWVLGGWAFSVAFREDARTSLQRTALGLAATVLGLRICWSLVSQLTFRTGMHSYPLMMSLHALFTILGLGALILLLSGSEEERGGRFEAAVAALVFAGGLGWIGLPVLAVAAMKGHPLLAAQWQALRNPKEVLEGGWFDDQDEGLRLRNLGACSLTMAAAFLALIGRLALNVTHGRAVDSWWPAADLASALLASLLLAIHVLRAFRRTGHRQGRGLAIAALVVAGLPSLLLLAGIVILVLILTDVIHFRLF